MAAFRPKSSDLLLAQTRHPACQPNVPLPAKG